MSFKTLLYPVVFDDWDVDERVVGISTYSSDCQVNNLTYFDFFKKQINLLVG